MARPKHVDVAFEAVPTWEGRLAPWDEPDAVAVATDGHDRVYVFVRAEPPVLVFGFDGTLCASWGEGLFVSPHSIKVDPEGHLWCVDVGGHVVRKCTPDGEVVLTLGAPGVVGAPGRPFNHPTDVTTTADGTVFVTDGYGQARVHSFAPDGRYIGGWGAPGSAPAEFCIPHAIVTAPDSEHLLVADRENDRIQIFDTDGCVVDIWDDVSRPTSLAFGRDGLLHVAELGERAGRMPFMPPMPKDPQHSRLSTLDANGAVVARHGSSEYWEPGSFFAAHGICVDSKGDVFVGEVARSAGPPEGEADRRVHALHKLRRRTSNQHKERT